MNLMMHQH